MTMGKEHHTIRLPGSMLDSIREKEEKGEYESRSYNVGSSQKGKKRKEKPQSRKEMRQNERKLKKLKRSSKPGVGKVSVRAIPQGSKEVKKVNKKEEKKEEKKVNKKEEKRDPLEELRKLKEKKGSRITEVRIVKEEDLDDDDDDDVSGISDDYEEDDEDEEDPMEALRRLKGNKKSSEIRIVKEAELDDESVKSFEEGSEEDDFEGFDEEFDEDDFEGFEEDFNEEDFDSEEEELEEEEDPLAKLKALKEAKKAKEITKKDKNEKKEKEAKKGKESTKKEKKDKKEKYILPPQVSEQMKKDEEEMEFYAKKLGLKGKNAKITKGGDDDMIGGLLDGLDFDFGSGSGSGEDEFDEQSEEEEHEEEVKEEVSEEKADNLNPFSSDDSLSEGDFDSDISDFEDEDDEEESTIPSKENPFIAPSTGETTKYIPPALRRKMAMENGEVSAETLALQKAIKSSFNKLSEANISSIVNDINLLYMSNPRHSVNESITNIVIDSIVSQERLLDTFVYLHSCVITAIYRLQGVEFGAHFIQTLVGKFDSLTDTKQLGNIVSLLSAVYSFSLISSRLIYDIIKVLIEKFNEANAEILLRLIRSSGNQIRTDDPGALKEIILSMNKVSTDHMNPRTQFLIETINSLKNNKLKITNDFSHDLIIRLKKVLGALGSSKLNDTIQVSLEDIRNVETKGKWWLVGSAWKGEDEEPEQNYNTKAMKDILDSAEPNWMQIAKDQRMNTDIRRAIFISIMSAEDYIDALTKLDKLALKKSQEREIPRILIHCVSVESSWNPYYGLLAHKLCDSHNHRKTFQFMFWDTLKEFEGTLESEFSGFDETDDSKVKRIYNLGRFYGYLLTEGSLPLHSLKNVNFLVLSGDNKLFLEVLLVTFLDQIGKKSQINVVGMGVGKPKGDMKFSDQLLIERVIKAKDQESLLRGLQYFVQEINGSNFVDGKRQRKRVEWGVKAVVDVIDELLRA